MLEINGRDCCRARRGAEQEPREQRGRRLMPGPLGPGPRRVSGPRRGQSLQYQRTASSAREAQLREGPQGTRVLRPGSRRRGRRGLLRA